MIGTIWHILCFDPVYNGLVFFIDIVPGGDVGIAIILTTIVVKIILLPLSLKAAKTQYVIRQIDPELKALKEKYKNKRQEQAKAMMELYKKAGVHPFSSIILLFIQIPIIIALYFSVSAANSVPLPDINVDILYSFIPAPETASMMFLGFIDIAARSLPLALLASATQFINGSLTLPKPTSRDPKKELTLKEDFARSMQIQMRYMMPILIFFIAYTFFGAVAIYFTVSNVMSIGQEFIVRKKGLKPSQEVSTQTS